jgi:hypothetical protein
MRAFFQEAVAESTQTKPDLLIENSSLYQVGTAMMTATRKKILIWILVLSLLSAIPKLPVPSFSTSPPAAQGQVVKEETFVKEVATVYPLFDYWPVAIKYIPEGASDIIVSGTIKELKNRAFDFYAFTRLNYERWKANASYQAIVEVKHVAAYSLSFSTTREDVTDGLRLVVSNIYLQELQEESLIDDTIKVYPYMTYSFWFSSRPLMIGYEAELNVRGTAREIHGYRFNLYVVDRKNYDLWSTGRSYFAYYAAKGMKSYDFSFTVPPEKVAESLYYVVERVDPDVELDVDVAATGSWLAPTTISVEYDVKISWREKASGCFIATAAYGSELEPQVQFIRDFRDRAMAPTFVGSPFLSVFNPFYYSFSPQVASFISMHEPVRQLFKYLLYPLVGDVRVVSWIYLGLGFNPELAAAAALLTMILLIVFFYPFPAILLAPLALRWLRKHRGRPKV